MKHIFTISLCFLALSLSVYGQVPDYVPTEGLVAWYAFNGDADDYAGLNFNGNALDVNYTENRFNQQDQAIELNGYNSLVELYSLNSFIDVDPIMSSYTVSLWFKFEYGQAWQTIFSDYAGLYPSSDPTFSTLVELERYQNVDDEYRLIIQGRHQHSSVGIDLGEVSPNDIWHNLTFSINPDLEMITAFFDGEFFEAPWLASAQFDYETSSENLFIGKRNNWSSDQYFNGSIDEFGIWNRALSAEEIEALYTADITTSGCTDSTANNFNPEATLDDGTCCYLSIAQNDTTICEGASISLDVSCTSQGVDLQNGLVAYYPFNGDANDESVNNYNGIVNGATLTTDRFGNSSSAYNFTGLANDITLSNSESIVHGSYSINSWCTIDLLDPQNYDAVLIGQFNGQIEDEMKWLFGYRSIQVNPPQRGISHYVFDSSGLNAVPDNSFSINWWPQVSTWYNITWVFDSGNEIRTYVNGVLHNTVPTSLINFNTSANNVLTKIGNGIDIGAGATLPWNGKIDDVGIWNRSLTPNEVQQLYNSSSTNSNLLWSTGDTTATITVTPSQTTTYWVEQTENGVSFTDEVTITVQSTGCGNSDACNFTEGDACDIDCVFANDCESLAALCGEGTVWDADAQECIVANPTDTNFDGCTDLNDLLDILSAYGDCAEVNYSLSFDGVDDYVEIPHISDYTLPSGEQTIQFNIKFSSFASSSVQADYVVWKIDESLGDGDLGMGFDCGVSNSAIHFRLWSGAYNTGVGVWINSSHVTLDEFEKVSFTVNDEELRAYLNGILVDSSNIPDGLVVGAGESPVWLSTPQGDVSGAGISFGGVLDNLEIWDSALTQEQIQSYMSTPPTGNEEGLVGYWDFNEGTGSTLTDQTSNGNDGIINGATWSTDVPTAP
jgi:hypothetical protein